MEKADFRKHSVEETFDALKSSAAGLTSDEAAERAQRYGYNEIIERRKGRLGKLARYLWGPLPWMIEAAAGLSALLQHWDDLAIILTLLVANAAIGFWQEDKADNAIELLKKRLAITARVLRDGKWATVPARELVPGDVVRIRLGDIAPADVKLLDGDYLMMDESALTGESLPVEKHVLDTTFSGAIVRQGEMDAIVTTTGQNTYFGQTAKLVQEAKAVSHLQRAVTKIGYYLIVVAVALVAIVFIASVLRGADLLSTAQFALILIIASVPVAMPAVLSVTMAVGAVELSKKEAIVTKLETIEEVAGMDVLCVDKTGTVTKNEITVAEVRNFGGATLEDVLGFAALASRREDNDPIEAAIFARAGASVAADMLRGYRVIRYRPFDPTTKRTEATCVDRNTGRELVVTKGAPQAVLSLVRQDVVDAEEVKRAVEDFALKGYRAIAVAEGPDGAAPRMVGILALYDPPREDAKETIKAARELGVGVKMVTGDHVAIARQMCSEVGIGSNIMLAQALQDPSTGPEHVEAADAFAEVYPEHKYSIVEALQGRDHIVGMTGDGVNDAPALKKAEVGIAVSNATDAARSAADIVLTAPGISVIIDAIKQSRMIFERMNSYATYRIAETIRVLLFLSLAIVVFNIYPLTVLMLVFLALLNDFPIMMIAYDNARVHDSPTRWDMRGVLSVATLLGVIGLVSSFVMLLLGIYVFKLGIQELETLMFLKMAVAGHMTIYLARSGRKHAWQRPFPSRRLFLTTEITQVAATVFVTTGILMAPISWQLALFVWAYALMFFVIADSIKVAYVRYRAKTVAVNQTVATAPVAQ